MIDAPVTTIAIVNTACRGNRRWNHEQRDHADRGADPSAVISRPNAALPPWSTSSATVGAERDDRAAADQPARQADHHAAHQRVRRG